MTEYHSVKSPGPGNYIIATKIGNRKIKKYKFIETIPRQDPTQPRPNMTTYDPVSYGTFKRIQKYDKGKNKSDAKI